MLAATGLRRAVRVRTSLQRSYLVRGIADPLKMKGSFFAFFRRTCASREKGQNRERHAPHAQAEIARAYTTFTSRKELLQDDERGDDECTVSNQHLYTAAVGEVSERRCADEVWQHTRVLRGHPGGKRKTARASNARSELIGTLSCATRVEKRCSASATRLI